MSSYNSTRSLGTHLIENTRIWNGKNELAQIAQKRPISDYSEDVREKECSHYRSNYRPPILENVKSIKGTRYKNLLAQYNWTRLTFMMNLSLFRMELK